MKGGRDVTVQSESLFWRGLHIFFDQIDIGVQVGAEQPFAFFLTGSRDP